MKTSFFHRCLLAGFVFQSVMVGGGYATGRELVQFFLSLGPVAGLLAMGLATVLFSVLLALTFEFARVFQCYDYRTFFRALLGRGWVSFEIAYLLLMTLILAVIGAAAGEMVEQSLGWPSWLGTFILVAGIGLLAFYGTSLIERLFAGWSIVLYITFALLFYGVFTSEGAAIGQALSEPVNESHGWLLGGITYVGYSLAVIPAILFMARHFTCRRDAVISGMLAGPLAMIPAVLLYVVMLAFYPQITEQAVPTYYVIQQLNQPWLLMLFQIVIFGTFVETGAGLIHGFNERIADWMQEQRKPMPAWLRPALAIALCVLAMVLASAVGLIDLVAKGYGYSTWLFIGIVAVPLLTLGVWKLRGVQQSHFPS